MKDLINFFVEVGSLKFVTRSGWLLRKVKNGESIADHSFQLALMVWVLGDSKLNILKALKMALVHDLCEVYAGDATPYQILLDKGHSAEEIVKLWPRHSPKEFKKFAQEKSTKELAALLQLTSLTPLKIANEINQLWEDYDNLASKEAIFVYQLGMIEDLLQALEYAKEDTTFPIQPFWVQCREGLTDPILRELLASIHSYYDNHQLNVKYAGIIEFLTTASFLKRQYRRGWLVRGVKQPDSISGHSFRSALMAWVLLTDTDLDQLVILKMALIHDMYAAFTGDFTPYDRLDAEQKKNRKFIESLPWWGSKAEKELAANDRLIRELRTLDKILVSLPHDLRHDAKYLWLEYKTGTSPEGRLFRQVDRVETTMQAMQFHQVQADMPAHSFWLELKEAIDDKGLYHFVKEMDDFYFKNDPHPHGS